MILTTTILRTLAPKSEAERWSTALGATMAEFDISTPARAAAFLGQLLHESRGLTVFTENLNYSAERLLTGPLRSHFPTAAVAAEYAHRPERIANRAYAGRFGNGDEASGDGWRFRGRGPIQLTFHDNYLAAEQALGVPLVSNPDAALNPLTGSRIAGWYWDSRSLNDLADAGDIPGIRRKVNGGQTGLDECKVLTARALPLLQAAA